MFKRITLGAIALAVAVFATFQLVPAPPVEIPAELPPTERAAHRVLGFEEIANFRDLGGYRTRDGKQVRWGALYRSGHLADATDADLEQLQRLNLSAVVDFRSQMEKTEQPDRFPKQQTFSVVPIPVLDEGNNTMVKEITARMEEGNFEGFDAGKLMIGANEQFATQFTPQFRQFFDTVLDAGGKPVLWHCTAGKDRTGYAAAVLLRMLGVPRDTIMADYMASRELSLAAHRRDLLLVRLFKGGEAERNVRVLMGVEQPWLEAAFNAIDQRWGSFDNYVREGLQLSATDIQSLKSHLLR